MITRSCVSLPSEIRIFRPTKCKKLGTLKPLVLRFIRNLILKCPKCRQRAHTTTFTIGRKGIFRLPKCIKWATRKYVPLNRRFHDSPKIEIIKLPKCKNELENAMYPWTVGFMTRQKLHHVFHYSAEIAFSGHQNAENELIQRYVPLNRGFHVSEKSHFQVSKMKKIYSK